jgi:hypothetical protein
MRNSPCACKKQISTQIFFFSMANLEAEKSISDVASDSDDSTCFVVDKGKKKTTKKHSKPNEETS